MSKADSIRLNAKKRRESFGLEPKPTPLKLYQAQTPMGLFYMYCYSEQEALKIFRHKFIQLQFELSEVKNRRWIADGNTVLNIVGR